MTYLSHVLPLAVANRPPRQRVTEQILPEGGQEGGGRYHALRRGFTMGARAKKDENEDRAASSPARGRGGGVIRLVYLILKFSRFYSACVALPFYI